jgi:fatty acid-binding protein DegV
MLIVPDPRYLVAGGRVSNFKGMLVKLFHLKLVLTLDDKGLNLFDKTSKLDKLGKIFDKCCSKRCDK